MAAIQDYPSRLSDPASRRYETFSYLPEQDGAGIRDQVGYALSQGWTCAIEHIEPSRAASTYWYLWKLPLFGVTDVEAVVDELEACRDANPRHHVRLVGYDSHRQTQGLAMVVFRGDPAF